MKDETKKNEMNETADTSTVESVPELDPNWASEALQELEDWIESQGIYIRQ